MTNRDFLKQVSTDEIPDAETMLRGEKKPRRVWRRVAVAAVAAVAIGAIGTAAAFELGIITIGPAAEQLMSMTPQDWDAYDNGEFDMPEFNVDEEISAMEEYVGTLNIITDPDELRQDVEYNVLGISTVGIMPTYAFCEYDPDLWDLCWNPEVMSSINPLQCPMCESDKFYFVRKGSDGSFVEDGIEYSWDSSVWLQSECGNMINYRLGDVDISEYEVHELPEGYTYIEFEAIDNADGTVSFGIRLTDEPPTHINLTPVTPAEATAEPSVTD